MTPYDLKQCATTLAELQKKATPGDWIDSVLSDTDKKFIEQMSKFSFSAVVELCEENERLKLDLVNRGSKLLQMQRIAKEIQAERDSLRAELAESRAEEERMKWQGESLVNHVD